VVRRGLRVFMGDCENAVLCLGDFCQITYHLACLFVRLLCRDNSYIARLCACYRFLKTNENPAQSGTFFSGNLLSHPNAALGCGRENAIWVRLDVPTACRRTDTCAASAKNTPSSSLPRGPSAPWVAGRAPHTGVPIKRQRKAPGQAGGFCRNALTAYRPRGLPPVLAGLVGAEVGAGLPGRLGDEAGAGFGAGFRVGAGLAMSESPGRLRPPQAGKTDQGLSLAAGPGRGVGSLGAVQLSCRMHAMSELDGGPL
jgi:hypothetical protein